MPDLHWLSPACLTIVHSLLAEMKPSLELFLLNTNKQYSRSHFPKLTVNDGKIQPESQLY